MSNVSRETSEDVRERDAHECQRCLKKGKNTLHHIKRSSEGGSDDESNLILLCRKCHDLIERLYDKGSVTAKSFYSWLENERRNLDERRPP